MGYQLTGRMAEVCSCKSLCPCAVGEDPDSGYCGFSWVFHFDRGEINEVDVSGLNLAFLGNHRGNVYDGKVRLAVIIDERADDAQQGALVEAFTGKAGGPLADLAALVSEVVGVIRTPIEFDVDKGTGSFTVQGVFEGDVRGFTAPDGTPTTLSHAVMGSLVGTPAYPGKVARHEVTDAEYGLQFKGRQATQTEFHYVAA
ncbi:DUF1326 domain-containing protein [Pseudonocardia asaccharolytica]|uniref:DUF1326 domain-containing protein n=1 Tax=Pseudonocardia asaccharolytica DSM 44247 = NBRC 16224 TaxID=1123024 RepID=A0A511CYQ4_9PSEU|nr:DUF1326 domain-containing protein [Pseudonocardia asaccharolytica]GEL17393.1 hypothetical protein PA7_12300 [Pseudonocardia asaccharolytica DSM 44247 = NBRC 16224]